jgi:hypothetical protein
VFRIFIAAEAVEVVEVAEVFKAVGVFRVAGVFRAATQIDTIDTIAGVKLI